MVKDYFVMSNGVKVPRIAFGTWKLAEGTICETAVKTALDYGYRYIDAAAIYENERSVGKGIKASGLKREDLFISSKLWNTEHGYETTLAAFEKTIKDLQVDYLDMYLIHWPNPIKFRDCYVEKNIETWKAFEKLYKEGKIKSIGVSNFFPYHIKEMLPSIEIMPMVNQIEFRPSCILKEIIDYCIQNNILVTGYSPLAGGRIFQMEEFNAIASKYNKSVAQVVLRWSLQHGIIPLPKSAIPEQIKENLEIFDFELEQEDMNFIDAITTVEGLHESEHPDEVDF